MDSVTSLLAWKGKAARLRKLQARGSTNTDLLALPLLDFVPAVTPRFLRPSHLADLTGAVEKAAQGVPQRWLVSIPPRHSKTETVLHAIAWWLRRRPYDSIGYVSYAADIARSKSREARNYAREAGVQLADDSAALHEWRTPQGGGCLATGVGGPLTGHGVNLLIVDDPFKNRQEADSPTIRENVHQWFTSTAMTRVEPGGSVIVVHTRWHEDDLIGRLSKDGGWQVLNLPALSVEGKPSDTGEALWPERWPREALLARKAEVLPWDWDSLYQGAPKPKQGLIFDEFDEAVHVVDTDFAPSIFRRVLLAQDFGWTAPGCTLVIGDLGGRFVVLDESYASQRIFLDDRLEQQAGAVLPTVPRPTWVGEDKRLIARWSGHQRSAQVLCDPAEPDKIHDLVRSSVYATAADNDVLYGLRQLQTALHIVDGRPALTIHRRCENLIRELKSYRRAVDRDGKPTDYPADGQDDHAIDPLRYGLCELMRYWKPGEPSDPPPTSNQAPPPWQRRGGGAFGF